MLVKQNIARVWLVTVKLCVYVCACVRACVLELSLSYGRRSFDQFILVSGSPLGPTTRFYSYPSFSDNCFVVPPVGRPL
jgi:hypothetical protein